MPKKFSKFKVSGELPNVRLMPRDRQLFSYLERYTLLRTDHLHRTRHRDRPAGDDRRQRHPRTGAAGERVPDVSALPAPFSLSTM